MPTNPQPDTCVQCGGVLLLYEEPHPELLQSIDLPYCPNPACPNYGLVTVGRSGVDNG